MICHLSGSDDLSPLRKPMVGILILKFELKGRFYSIFDLLEWTI